MSEQTERIKLTGRVPGYLELASARGELRDLAMMQVRIELGDISEEYVWGLLEENSRYARVINFSSRPVGKEEEVGYVLMGMPPSFSALLLDMYRKQDYLTRQDVRIAYRVSGLLDLGNHH